MTTPESESIPDRFRVFVLSRMPRGAPVVDDVTLVEIPPTPLRPGDFLVRNEYFSVDASMRRRMSLTPSAYLPPYRIGAELDGWAVGPVVSTRSSRFAVGDWVLHYLGWRDYAHLRSDDVGWTSPRRVAVDGTRPPETYLGPLGPSGLTSWAGLLLVAELRDDDVVFVSAAAGAVGSLAVQMAKRLGHRVIGSAGTDEKVHYVTTQLGADAAFNYRTEPVRAALNRLAPAGLDVYFDNVGAGHLDAALAVMRPGGRIALCGSIADYNADGERAGIKNLFAATERGLTLRGFLARMYADRWDDFQADVSAWLTERSIRFPVHIRGGLPSAPEALIDLLAGGNIGKTMIRLNGG